MNKIINPCKYTHYNGRQFNTYVKIEFKDGDLSITGVEGPRRGGDCYGSCGQIVDHLDPSTPCDGWTSEMITKLQAVWREWHLNDMEPACEHQRALGWDTEKIDPALETGWHVNIHNANLKGWEHPPVGHLTEACPVCGYEYGTAWLKKEAPADVIAWLESLPDSKVTPAWV